MQMHARKCMHGSPTIQQSQFRPLCISPSSGLKGWRQLLPEDSIMRYTTPPRNTDNSQNRFLRTCQVSPSTDSKDLRQLLP
jgi:hypothetical protein